MVGGEMISGIAKALRKMAGRRMECDSSPRVIVDEKLLCEEEIVDCVERYEYKHPSYNLVERTEAAVSWSDYPDPRYYRLEDMTWASRSSKKKQVKIIIAGDLLCQEGILNAYALKKGEGFDFSPCFKYLAPILKSADLSIGNLETPISKTAPYRGEIITHEGPFFCNAPVEYLKAIKDAGFDMVTTANNHTIDAGVRGLIETVNECRSAKLIQTGTFTDASNKFEIVDICGIKVGFTAFSSAYNTMDENMTRKGRIRLLNTYSKNRAISIIEKMKEMGAEYTVCFPHWGKEYETKPSIKQRNIAAELAEVGYDCIIGSHSHVLQDFSVLEGGIPVVYSLGNILSSLNNAAKAKQLSQYPALCMLTLSRTLSGVKGEISFIPCRIVKNLGDIPYTVLPFCPEMNKDPLAKEALEEAPEKVAGYLGVSVDDLELDYRLPTGAFGSDIASLGEFCKKEYLREGLLAKLKSSPTAPKSVAMLQNPGYEGFEKDSNSLYHLEENSYELVGIHGKASIVRASKAVKGLPVRTIGRFLGENNQVRLFYTAPSVRVIDSNAFSGFKALESVRLYSGLREIRECAFCDCPNLTGIRIPNNCKIIGERAFANCPKLLSVLIPVSVFSIADSAFEGSRNVTIFCEAESVAEYFAKRNNIPFKIMPLKLPDVNIKSYDTQSWSMFESDQSLPADAPHPWPIRNACRLLGYPLPGSAVCGNQPSYYLGHDSIEPTIQNLKKLLGDEFPYISEEDLNKRFRLFREEYALQADMNQNDTDFMVYFADWLLHARSRGFGHHCYFVYELYKKEIEIRDTFLNAGYRKEVARICAPRAYRGVFGDKASFNRRFSDYVHRDWVDATSCSYEEFCAFAQRNPKFFAKPVRGTGGRGAHVVKVDGSELRAIFDQCREENVICEEVVQQHDRLCEFNSSTLNTIRVTTLLCADGIPRIMLAAVRFGRKGNCADNFHSGGMGAVVDVDTGKVTSTAVDMYHQRFAVHPDSKMDIVGFEIPEWEKVKDAAINAALVVPELRHVGWDVAVRKDGRIELIEGNCMPGYDMMQSPDQIGKRGRYEEYIPALKKIRSKTKK